MAISDITKEAVESALQECHDLGQFAFLAKYGFADAKRYWIIWNGARFPSKAIAGVANHYIPGNEMLPSHGLKGGENTVVLILRKLGFEILDDAPDRNPAWSRDELILALDLYMTNPAFPPGKASVEVTELSDLLNKIHRLNGVSGGSTLRNTNGVYLKMMNLRALDPEFTSQGKIGMQRGGALDKIVWMEYQGRREALAADAMAIREAVKQANEDILARLPQMPPYEGEEGGVIIKLHKRYERDPRLVAEKRKAASLTGSWDCEVCGFDFEAAYGELGAEFIEIHHTKPVHSMKPGSKTRLSDLALLCSNCHRMAHRRRKPLSLNEIREALTKLPVANNGNDIEGL